MITSKQETAVVGVSLTAAAAVGSTANLPNLAMENDERSKEQAYQDSKGWTDIGKLEGLQFDHYEAIQRMGSGAFGVVYKVRDFDVPELFHACKIERADSKHPQVNYEARLIGYLHGSSRSAVGFPKCVSYKEVGYFNVMVMDLLGRSLEQLLVLCDRKFSLKTVLMLADQLIQRVEFIHSRNFLHRDVKPDNFLIGIAQQAHCLYMIDFGLAKRFQKDQQHIAYKSGKSLTGTARYASINTHEGIEQARRDDIESLGYLLVYFLNGSLPWQSIRAKDRKEKYEKIKTKKQSMTVEDVCAGLPREFAQFLAYAKSLKFTDKPDYNKCRKLFRDLMKTKGYDNDFNWDWNARDAAAAKQQAIINSQKGGAAAAAAADKIDNSHVNPTQHHLSSNKPPAVTASIGIREEFISLVQEATSKSLRVNGSQVVATSAERAQQPTNGGGGWQVHQTVNSGELHQGQGDLQTAANHANHSHQHGALMGLENTLMSVEPTPSQPHLNKIDQI